jgi:hypothetical protein
MRNCWSISRYTILVMVVSMKKKGPYTLFAEGAKHVHVWADTNVFPKDTWIFAAPDRAVDYR